MVAEGLEAWDWPCADADITLENFVVADWFRIVGVAVYISVHEGKVGHVQEVLNRAERVAVIVIWSS